MMFLGCVNGLFIMPYMSTELAPKEPMTNRLSYAVKYSLWIKPTSAMPTNEPRKVIRYDHDLP